MDPPPDHDPSQLTPMGGADDAGRMPAGSVTPTPSPRAFAHATGFVYQSIGFILALMMCCWWPANCWQDRLPVTQPADVSPEALRNAPAPDLWATAAVVSTFVGGLLLIGVGFGLQHDRLRTGRVPMILTAGIGLLFWVYLGYSVFSAPTFGRIALGALGALGWTVMFLLAGVSNEQLRASPPTRSEQSWTSRDEDEFRKSLSPGSRDKTNR